MTKVQIVVELTIDDSLEDIDTIIAEMDYNFSHVIIEEDQVGKGITEKELIIDTEILERIS